MTADYTVPGLAQDSSDQLSSELQDRLTALVDLELTLKHIHWNVVGPSFIGVHEMLDPQVDAVRAMVDAVAERIATLGGEPVGTPGWIDKHCRWDDYSIGRAGTDAHLAALDVAYGRVVADHRRCIDALEHLDLVTQDLLIEQAEQLEQQQWFVRAHLESASGRLRHAGARSEEEAAAAADSGGSRAVSSER